MWRRTPIFRSLQAQGVTSHREATHGRPSLRKRDPSDVYGDVYGPRCSTRARDMCRCTHDVRSIRVHQPSVDPLAYRETETRGEAPHSHGVSATRTTTIPPVRAASRAARRPSLTIVIVGRRRPPGRRLEGGTERYRRGDLFNETPGAKTARLTEGPGVRLRYWFQSTLITSSMHEYMVLSRGDGTTTLNVHHPTVQRERDCRLSRLMSPTSDVSAVGDTASRPIRTRSTCTLQRRPCEPERLRAARRAHRQARWCCGDPPFSPGQPATGTARTCRTSSHQFGPWAC